MSERTSPPPHPRTTPLVQFLRDLCLDLLALVWPTQCVVCRAPDRDLCDSCRAAIRAKSGEVMRARAPLGIDYFAAGAYEGALRAVLIGCKHGGYSRFARELGARLAGPLHAAARAGPTAPPIVTALIVTAPSRASRVRERGYRHVDLIVRAALCAPPAGGSTGGGHGGGARTGGVRTGGARAELRLLARALVAGRGRTGQVGLDTAGRKQNAARIRVSYRWRKRLRGAPVIIVDDIITTGATVAAMRDVLTAAGAHVIATVALCSVTRRDDALPLDPNSDTQSETERRKTR